MTSFAEGNRDKAGCNAVAIYKKEPPCDKGTQSPCEKSQEEKQRTDTSNAMPIQSPSRCLSPRSENIKYDAKAPNGVEALNAAR